MTKTELHYYDYLFCNGFRMPFLMGEDVTFLILPYGFNEGSQSSQGSPYPPYGWTALKEASPVRDCLDWLRDIYFAKQNRLFLPDQCLIYSSIFFMASL